MEGLRPAAVDVGQCPPYSIIGATKPEQREENAEASCVTLTSEEADKINAVMA